MKTTPPDALDDLRRQFVDQLAARADAIQERFAHLARHGWAKGEVDGLLRLVHGLTGAAGTFGMHALSEMARSLENQLANLLHQADVPDEAAWAELAAGVDRLQAAARRSRAATVPSLPHPLGPARDNPSPLIYLVEDDADQAAYLGRVLVEGGYRVQSWRGADAFRLAMASPDTERPAAVVVDMMLPEGDDRGAALICECGLGGQTGIPVVVASARDDLHARLSAFRAGASRYLVKPVQPQALVEQLDILTGRQPSDPYRVLLVDDDPLLLATHASLLREAGMAVLTLSEPLLTLDRVEFFRPDVLLLDVYMPEVTGPELAAVLRERDEHLHLPILFLSAEADLDEQLVALKLGGDDFLTKPIRPDHLVAAVAARARRARQGDAIRLRLQFALYEREREHLALNRHAIVSMADVSGNITYVNDRFCDISGYHREELLGQNHRLVKSGEHAPAFYHEMWETIAGGQVWQGEICNRRKDGSLYWVASTIVPFVDDDGVPYQYVSIRTDVTHVKAAEAAARASEARLDFIMTASPVVLYTLKAGEGFTPTYVSPNIRELFGFDPERFLATPGFWTTGIHPDDAPGVFDRFRDVLAEGGLVHEYRFRMPDGRYRWIHDSLRVVRDAAGRPREIVGYWADIDERVRAEQAAEHHKERLRRGQLYANIGTWDWNIQTGELYWTERIAPLFGYPEGDLETSYGNFLNAVHPDDRQAVLDAVDACVKHDVPYEIEHRVIWPDGTVRWLLERGAVTRDADGKPLHMLGVVQDVDDRKRAELVLAQREQQLREAQRLAQLGNWAADLRTGELAWSDEIYRIFGHEPRSVAPSVEAFHAAVHPDDRERVYASERLAEQVGRHDVVHRIVRPNGEIRHVHELARVERDTSGHAIRLIGTVQDITEQVRAEQALVAARDEAERANRAKSEFLSRMSHELRTPMNAILGFGQLLEYDDSLPGQHLDSVREILKAGHHLLALINEVLDLAKVESGSIDLSLEPVDVCPVVDECIGLITPLADRRGIVVSHDGLSGAAVRADRMRLKQALINLLSNAIKYNREGGSVRLDVRAVGEDRLRLRVSDTGSGIAPERLPELFQPFSRLGAENGAIEGTGIGLTITRRIVEMMGGSVGVDSELGLGSSFWIELPREAVPRLPGDDAAVEAGPPGDVVAGEARRTVLYIEDNPSNIKLVAQLLGRRRHTLLLTAHTPELGIHLARTRRPELILLDINMPGMDGYQVLEILRADPQLNDTPVVAVTASALATDIERGMAAGFADYLTKPLDAERLGRVVDGCLAGRGLHESGSDAEA